jgi:hypothetical protein
MVVLKYDLLENVSSGILISYIIKLEHIIYEEVSQLFDSIEKNKIIGNKIVIANEKITYLKSIYERLAQFKKYYKEKFLFIQEKHINQIRDIVYSPHLTINYKENCKHTIYINIDECIYIFTFYVHSSSYNPPKIHFKNIKVPKYSVDYDEYELQHILGGILNPKRNHLQEILGDDYDKIS